MRTRELGYPEGDFDRVLERAIGVLLQTPALDEKVALEPKGVTYEYSDPKLESLSPAQKQFLRMGPRNSQADSRQARRNRGAPQAATPNLFAADSAAGYSLRNVTPVNSSGRPASLVRNVTAGSTRAARRAGAADASAAVSARTIATDPNVSGSSGSTPYRNAEIERLRIAAAIRPMTAPTPTTRAAPPRTRPST